MNDFSDADVKCPFYIKTDTASIFCEGVGDNMATKNIFRTSTGVLLKKEKERYMCKFCSDCYKDCMVYQMLMKKYS